METGLAIVSKAIEKEREERIREQWVAQLPAMALSGKHISFADYKDKVTGANIDRRSAAAILAELDELERELQEGGGA